MNDTAALLSEHRVRDLLATRQVAALATLEPDGSPLVTPMWFAHRDGGILMVSVSSHRKVRNLRRDPRASLAVETGEGGDIKCVMMQGVVEFVDEPDRRRRLAEHLLRKYHPHLERRWGARDIPTSRALFELRPTKVSLWNFDR